MFDAQSLLGGLLREVSSSNGGLGKSLGSKAGLGMGALGIAMAAFEHFTKDKTSSPQTAVNNPIPSPNTQPRTAATPPPIMASSPVTDPISSASPPVPPSAATSASASPPPPPPPPPPANTANTESAQAQTQAQANALLLIDAMLAVANADGYIDAEEETKILKQLTQINSDQEGFDYVQKRIENPPSLEQICASTNDPELAKQIYMVSLMAITLDTQEEEIYLNNLASCLPIDEQTVLQLNNQFLTT